MIIVTGGAGMIGSNVIRALNNINIYDIIIVDNLKNGRKFLNLKNILFKDYIDKDDFIENILKNKINYKIDFIFHLGACSATTEWDGKYLMKNNYEYSKLLLNFSICHNIPFVYASSASVYGLNDSNFSELQSNESPINMYAYSKLAFDNYVRSLIKNTSSLIVGLRYFNVYGPNETHKGSMASTIYHFSNQLVRGNKVLVFEGTEAYGNGEQMRDFVYVKDCALANLWFYQNFDPINSGIYNIGTGQARSFNDVANEVIKYFGRGEIEYITFPENLIGSYQNYTCAEILSLNILTRNEIKFRNIEEGIQDYLSEIII
jgi:ADP-L-glycero-D-manno-heptose 6-epimerase